MKRMRLLSKDSLGTSDEDGAKVAQGSGGFYVSRKFLECLYVEILNKIILL